jgi:hypothetical protein
LNGGEIGAEPAFRFTAASGIAIASPFDSNDSVSVLGLLLA